MRANSALATRSGGSRIFLISFSTCCAMLVRLCECFMLHGARRIFAVRLGRAVVGWKVIWEFNLSFFFSGAFWYRFDWRFVCGMTWRSMLRRHFSVFKFIIALLIQSSSAIIQLSFYGFIAALSAEISRRVDKSFGQQKTTADGTQNARNERRTRFVYPGDQLIARLLIICVSGQISPCGSIFSSNWKLS